MEFIKCPVCKMMISKSEKICPVCRTEFSWLQRFKMNWGKRTIALAVALVLIYNLAVIISFNKSVRKIAGAESVETEMIEGLAERYNRLNIIQKKLVHSSEYEYLMKNRTDNDISYTVVEQEYTVYFDDGSINGLYTGEILNTRPNGEGKFDYVGHDGLGYVYVGEFVDGEMYGSGELRNEHGEMQVGVFKSGVLSGKGTVYNPDGYKIKEGYFINGKLNGRGTIYDDTENEIYKGEFLHDIPQKSEYKSECEQIGYEYLKNHIELYKSKNIKITGNVVDGFTNSDYTRQYTLAFGANTDKSIRINYKGAAMTVRQNDELTFYGYCTGYEDYMNADGSVGHGIVINAFYAE